MTLRRVAFVCLLAAACLAVFAAPAAAKEYHISTIDMRCVVGADGTMTVTETRRVAFDGSFHWAQWALDSSGSEGIEFIGIDGPDGKPMTGIEGTGSDLEQTPAPGTYVLMRGAGRVVLKVGFDVEDQTVPFVLRYKALGAAKRWTDTAELYWKFVGDETDVRTDKVHVEIGLPEGVARADVKAWAHGPLNGVVAIAPTGRSVTLDVTDLPPNTFVEGRVLFPAAALPGAREIPTARLATVQQEEARWAEQANAQRTAARNELRRQRVLGGIGIAVPLLALVGVIFLYFRYGKEYAPQFPGGYFRDIPADLAPPLVGALWRMGAPEDRDIGATLMDLSLKDAVYMRPVVERVEGGFLGIGGRDESTYELTLIRDKLAQTDPHEQSLALFLFDDTMRRDAFTIKQLRDEAKERPREFTSGLNAWKASVAERASQLGWIEKSGKGAQAIAFLLSVLGAIVPFLIATLTGALTALFGLPLAIPAFIISFFVTRRSREAVELFAKYKGLERYMRDFGRMQEKPPASVVLWEQYLVLAVVFGIAEEVIAQMRVAVPEVVDDPAFATAYWWAYPAYGTGSSPVSNVSAGMASAVAAASSEMASSSGGGGGFSGGGGGGGGGGGFSAG